MKVLLIGGSGQLGRSLQSVNWDNSVEIESPSSDKLDISSLSSTSEYIKNFQPNFVINSSAWTNVPGAEVEYDQALKLNSEAVRDLASVCKTHNSALVHISTDYVFDGKKGEPYRETDLCNPLNAYGKSKLDGEEALIESGLQDYFIIRTSWLYSKFGKNFVKTIVRKAMANETALITDDQFGSPTFAGNLASAVASLVATPPTPGIYHFSDKGITSWFEFGKEIYKNVGADVNLVSPRKTEISELKRPAYSPFDLSKWSATKLHENSPWQDSLQNEISSIVSAIQEEDK